jgi:hypothetical protein
VETARERAISFLYGLRGGAMERVDRARDEGAAHATGATGALQAAGLLNEAEAEEWRVRLATAPDEDPAPASDEEHARAAALLGELLDAVPAGDDAMGPELNRFEGAVAALHRVSAIAGAEWDRRLRARLGRQSAEDEHEATLAMNAGGTEQDLVAVLPGPQEDVDGVRVLYALRFADGIGFVIERPELDHDDIDLDLFEELTDDLGTWYAPAGGSGGPTEERITFRTAPPPGAKWVELTGVASRPIRVSL